MKCEVCGSSKIRKLFESVNSHGRHLINENEKFQTYRCDNCHAILLSDIHTSQKYHKKYYLPGYYDQVGIASTGFLNKLLSFMTSISNKNKEKLITKNLTTKNKRLSILDIGCGNGKFLLSLDSNRFNKFGLEINREGYEISKRNGLNVLFGDISKIDHSDKKFDVVSIWHVLEHIEKPVRFIKTIHKILKPHGLMIFQTPNTDSLGFIYGTKNWFHLDSPRHLVLYNKKSIETLCNKTGFKLAGTKNIFYDYPLDLFWSLRKSPIRFLIYPLYPIFKIIDSEDLIYICEKHEPVSELI